MRHRAPLLPSSSGDYIIIIIITITIIVMKSRDCAPRAIWFLKLMDSVRYMGIKKKKSSVDELQRVRVRPFCSLIQGEFSTQCTDTAQTVVDVNVSNYCIQQIGLQTLIKNTFYDNICIDTGPKTGYNSALRQTTFVLWGRGVRKYKKNSMILVGQNV